METQEKSNEAEEIKEGLASNLINEEELGLFSSLWKYGWKPTSMEDLVNSEKRLLSVLKTPYKTQMIEAGGYEVNTLIMGSGPPLVMVHGFGGGLALWVTNLDDLSKHFTIYAIDLVGFGRSSRPNFLGTTPEEAEDFFVESLEAWRSVVGLKKINLLGHSLGAFIVSCYALKYPAHIEKLFLADPWGVPKKPEEEEDTKDLSIRWRVVTNVLKWVPTPLYLLRALGPYGPGMIDRLRPDLSEKFSHLFEKPGAASKYIYHCNAQNPTGEMVFTKMQIPFGWAKKPLIDRLHLLDKNIKTFMIYGKKSWMDFRTMITTLPEIPSPVELVLLPKAGHHVYVDNYRLFNLSVIYAGINVSLKDLVNQNVNYYSNIKLNL